MWIQNVSLSEAINGLHYFERHKTVLIRIKDYDTVTWEPVAYQDRFVEVHQFAFDDHDDPDSASNITVEQAEQIAKILTRCKDLGYNVVVHCHAGICRSGAVTEVGVLMGFQDTDHHRIPNILVKNRLKDALGMKTDYNEVFKYVIPEWE